MWDSTRQGQSHSLESNNNMYLCVYVCARVCVCVYCVCARARVYVCMRVCVRVCVCLCVCGCVCVCVWDVVPSAVPFLQHIDIKQTYQKQHTHTHTHTHTHRDYVTQRNHICASRPLSEMTALSVVLFWLPFEVAFQAVCMAVQHVFRNVFVIPVSK